MMAGGPSQPAGRATSERQGHVEECGSAAPAGWTDRTAGGSGKPEVNTGGGRRALGGLSWYGC